MTEISEFSISTISSSGKNIQINSYFEDIDNQDENNYPIRCPICYSISELKADFKSNYYKIKCENNHEKTFDLYNLFTENTFIEINNILCNICKKSLSEINLFRCNKCFLFMCDDCKLKHSEESEHNDFTEISNIDISFPKEENNFFNKKDFLPDISEINSEYEKVLNNLNISHKISKIFKVWLNNLYNSVTNYCNALNNYCLTQKKLIGHLKNNYNIYKNENKYNRNAFMNLYYCFINKNFIDNYFFSMNKIINKINDKNESIEKNSINLIKLLDNFEKINNFNFNELSKRQILKKNIKEEIKENSSLKQFDKKINEMQKIKIHSNSEVKSFASFFKGKYIIFGLVNGSIEIYEIPQNQNSSNTKEFFNLKSSIKPF